MAHQGRGRKGGWWHPRRNFPRSNDQSFRGAGGGSPWPQTRSYNEQWQQHHQRFAAPNQWPRQ